MNIDTNTVLIVDSVTEIKESDKVIVTGKDGQAIKGDVEDIDSSYITIELALGEIIIDIEDIESIELVSKGG